LQQLASISEYRQAKTWFFVATPKISGLLVFGMLRSIGFSLTLLFCVSPITVLAAQNEPSLHTHPADGKPTPLLPPEGLSDENGWTWPGNEWQHVSPESEGFSSPRLDALRSFLKTHQTDAMMVLSRGHVVFEYGDAKLVSKVASVRKSVLSLLCAVEMQKGVKIDLDQTVEQLGLEDKTPSSNPNSMRPLSN
jgi:hypothetical protein